MLEWVRFIVAGGLMLAGLFIAVTATFGVFKLKNTLSRMHSAAMGDTMGILLVLTGLMIFMGFQMVTLKLFFIVLFLWFASPVSSHLLARLEVTTNEELEEECEVIE